VSADPGAGRDRRPFDDRARAGRSEPAFHARSALGEAIGRRAADSDRIPAAAAALRQLLADPEPSVRTGAIRGIGLLGEPLDAVEPFAGDPDWRVRSAVADVLRLT
jgi:HEAT repeat protein